MHYFFHFSVFLFFYFPLVDNGNNTVKETPTPLVSPGVRSLDSNVEQQSKEDTTHKNCSTCNKLFKSQYAYMRHLCHCKSTVMECSICEMKFSNGKQMRQDILEYHEGKLWTCTYEGCFRYFGTKKGMTYHLEEHISKQFSCNSCNEEFVNAEELNTHKKSAAHKQRSKQSVCKPCKSIFSGKYEMDRHYKTTCPFNSERMVKCKVCNQNTGKAHDFLIHLQEKHNSKMHYLCTRCLLDFASEKLLDKHQETCKIK